MAARDDYRWLVSDAAEPWLAKARDELHSARGASVALVSRLRKDLSTARAHLVVEQVELRQRARGKFSLVEQMFFTRKGLEQATDDQIAACKAARFSGQPTAADLCCGIGGDAIALAAKSVVTAVERDPVTALLAEANARRLACEDLHLTFRVGDATEFAVADVSAWHVDPDRRPGGRRATRAELFDPPLEAIQQLLAENLNAAIKLAPATDAPQQWAEAAELEWLGSRGECRQQVVWFGRLARNPGRRSAAIVDAARGPRTVIGTADDAIPIAARLGNYLYEPHPAVLAAKLTGALCREHSLVGVSAGIAYLSGDRLVGDPALAAFEVRDTLPLDRKQLKSYCRERAIGRLEVKKRGVELDPERLRREVVSDGDHEATLIVAPLAGQVRVMVARRIVRSSTG